MKDFWSGRRVLVTGHTGFKGAWLCLWLEQLGAKVSAFALPPESEPSLATCLAGETQEQGSIVDLTDVAGVADQVALAQPEIVLHLAAQALVRRSYRDPVGTFATNVMGTANLLGALRSTPCVKAVVVVTTDKVYRNDGKGLPFAEDGELGGKDPYSASKACAELVCASFRDSFPETGPALATARAGNVVGGGDWSSDRLVPDFVRSLALGEPIRLRYPDAIRPWQHVLEPLAGYLALARALVERPAAAPRQVNFGPDPDNFAPVHRIVETLGTAFGIAAPWQVAPGPHPPEAAILTLRSDLAAATLDWQPRLSLHETLQWTADWYRAHRDARDMRAISLQQIARYEELLS